MSKNAPRATKREKARTDLILSLTCVYCTLSGDFRKRPLENHHIVRGNKRLGHWYTLQVCVGHHQGQYTDQAIRVGIHSGRHALKEAYGYDELELWQRQQVALGLDDELPATKVLPRRKHVGLVANVPRPADAESVQPRHAGSSDEAGTGSATAQGDRA